GIDRHRLVPGVDYCNTWARRAHHGRRNEERLPKRAYRFAARIEISRVVSVHEAVTSGLNLGVNAGGDLVLERSGSAAGYDRALHAERRECIQCLPNGSRGSIDCCGAILRSAPVLRGAVICLQTSEGEVRGLRDA